MRIFLLLFVLTFTFGCATRNIKYDRNKILKKYSAEYKMFVDNEKTDLETVFLDKDNIESILIDKRTKELKITQLKRTELFQMNKLNLDSLSAGQRGWNKKKIELIVIDGIPITDTLLEKTKIDPNAIKSFNILTQEMMQNTNLCRAYNGSVILITTK